jgi:Domain of unknown function (DUF5655)
MEIEDFFAGHPDADAVFETVCSVLDGLGTVEVRTSKSQVAFRGKRGFAFLWLPGQYLATPTAEVVLSIALGRHDPSTRFKQVVHPAAAHWMHQLEVHDVGDIDDEVVGWLREPADRAA